MIESKVNKKYLLWVFLGLIVAGLTTDIFSIYSNVANLIATGGETKALVANVMLYIFQLVGIDGVVTTFVLYLVATVLLRIMSRASRNMYISTTDFVFYFMLFSMIVKFVMAVLNVLQFLEPKVYIFELFFEYLVIGSFVIFVMYFAVLLPKYLPKGTRANSWIGFALPYTIVLIFRFASNFILWKMPQYGDQFFTESTKKLLSLPMTDYFAIASGIFVGLLVAVVVIIYFILKKSEKGVMPPPRFDRIVPNPDMQQPQEEKKVFEEFDI